LEVEKQEELSKEIYKIIAPKQMTLCEEQIMELSKELAMLVFNTGKNASKDI
jgi:hypothetical protein